MNGILSNWPLIYILVEDTFQFGGLFTLPDSDSDSDSKPKGYIELGISFHTTQSHIQIPILTTNWRSGLEIPVCTRPSSSNVNEP